jgi:hypothetical protein
LVFFTVLGIVTFVLTEAAYRLYLRHALHVATQAKAIDDPAPSFGFYVYPAPWRLDRDLGFAFNDGEWRTGYIGKGAFSGCSVSGLGNQYGNYGAVRGDYASAQVKVVVFGSSYTLMDPGMRGDTSTNLLQDALSRKFEKTAHVLNYSRDSIGILTMFQMAAIRAQMDKPDIILFVFNTAALAYQRNWRVVKESQPGFFRMYQTLDPDDKLTPGRAFLNTIAITDQASKEWCDGLAASIASGNTEAARQNPVVVGLINEYNAMTREQMVPKIAVSFLTLDQSYVYNALRYRNPYRDVQIYEPKSIFAPASIDSYGDDPRFLEDLAAIKASGIPFLLVHVPTLMEYKAQKGMLFGLSGVPEKRERSLIQSLEALTGKSLINLPDYYDPDDLADPVQLVSSEQDSHPSPKGVRAIADALLKLLISQGFAP